MTKQTLLFGTVVRGKIYTDLIDRGQMKLLGQRFMMINRRAGIMTIPSWG